MSCLDVMYQVYAPPQPYFTATYSPYHHQNTANRCTFSFQQCCHGKRRTQEHESADHGSSLFFSTRIRAAGKGRGTAGEPVALRPEQRDGSFPMSQRSFPPSFWNSAYQPSVTASLSSALGASHTELPFAADPYSTASLHSHLHQATPEPWHPTHHHHHHPYSLSGAISTQSSAYPRPSMHDMYGTHFDPRYGSLLVPSVRPHRLPAATVPAPGPSPCDISKSEPASSAWTGAFAGTGSDMGQSLSLNVDT
ncbi:hypothetical protein NFI96_014867, partial [Prochilodus magdalenae]